MPKTNRELASAPPAGIERARALLEQDVRAAAEARSRRRAPNTLLAYERDWREFMRWMRARGMNGDPRDADCTDHQAVGLVTTYVAAMERGSTTVGKSHAPRPRSAATIARRLAGIAFKFAERDREDPTRHRLVRDALDAARRSLGVRPKQKIALLASDIAEMVDAVPHGPARAPTVCLLLVAFSTACRRSELADIRLSDVTMGEQNARILLRRSKTDQAGAGLFVDVIASESALCPVIALRAHLAWRRASGAHGESHLFVREDGKPMTGREIAAVVKRYAAAGCGSDPREVGAHSLRAGHITFRHNRGDSLHDIAEQTHHKSLDTLNRYIRTRPELDANKKHRVL